MTGELSVLDQTGDTKVAWDSENDDEIAAARRTFNDLRGKGYLAFRVNKQGDKGQEMREFDPEAEKIILAPQMRGG